MKRKLRKLETSIIFILKMSLYAILFFIFYIMYAQKNRQLYNVSRTSVIVIVSCLIMGYMFSNIYGRYDIGKRKSKPIVNSIFLTILFTNIVGMLALSVMNTNTQNNHVFELEQPFLIIPITAIQYIVILIYVYGGNALYFKLYDPENVLS